MAPKRLKRAVTSSNFNKERFCSSEAEERFSDTYKNCNVISERGFDNPSGQVQDIFQENNWDFVVAHPTEICIPIVQEFYSNAPNGVNNRVYVRGIMVDYSSSNIRNFYSLPVVAQCSYVAAQQFPPNHLEVVDFLSHLSDPNIFSQAWKMSGNNPRSFSSRLLSSNSMAWHVFISSKIIPSGHTSDVTLDRAILNFLIQKRQPVDLAGIIFENLSTAISSGRAALPFGSLICGLCANAGIQWGPEEPLLPLRPAITKARLHNLGGKEKGIEEQEEGPSGTKGKITVEELAERIDRLTAETRDEFDYLDDVMTDLWKNQTTHYQYVSETNEAMIQMFRTWNPSAGPPDVSNFPKRPDYLPKPDSG